MKPRNDLTAAQIKKVKTFLENTFKMYFDEFFSYRKSEDLRETGNYLRGQIRVVKSCIHSRELLKIIKFANKNDLDFWIRNGYDGATEMVFAPFERDQQ